MKKREELIILAVLLLTDGSVSFAKGTAEISFTSNSKKLQKMFKKLSKNIFNVKKFIVKKSKANVPTIKFYSKKAGETLVNLCNTFRTKACLTFPQCPYLKRKKERPCKVCNPIEENGVKFPRVIMNTNPWPKKLICEVLRVAFTTDGAICVSRRKSGRVEIAISLKCYNPSLRKIFAELLNKVGISYTISREGIKIRKRSEIIKFGKMIGFIPGVKIGRDSKYWKGREKLKVLKSVMRQLLSRQAGAKPSQCAQARRGDPECPCSAWAFALCK